MASRDKFSKDLDRASVTIVGSSEGPMPPLPVVPPDVTKVGLPSQSESVEDQGTTLDYLPLAIYCKQKRCTWTIEKIKSPIMSIMTPSGKVVQPKHKVNGSYGGLLWIFMIDPKSSLGDGTYINQTRFWQRLTQSWIPANEPHVTRIAVTQGITETESQSLSFTVGAKIGFAKKVINAELSASLTKSFGYSVSIHSESTVTDEFPFSAQPVEQVVGVYQLMERFMVYPGPNLANYVAGYNEHYRKICKSMKVFCMSVAAELPMTYPTSSYLQIAGTNDPTQLVEQPMLSQQEIGELVKNSIKLTKE